jgi:hypothetical protein
MIAILQPKKREIPANRIENQLNEYVKEAMLHPNENAQILSMSNPKGSK